MRLPNVTALLPFGAIPEAPEGRLDPALQLSWIDRPEFLVQTLTSGVVENTRFPQPLVRGSRRIVHLRHPRSGAPLADQFAHGPQEVQLQAEERVKLLQRLKGGLGVVAVVANAAAHAEPV